ncbi:uncharacterized protein [Polyergus mexicanus]|uniref:uncharacterized protein n=1 Tax=Polyergus mexicanus TaxID=615972 RepID=UPI0038B652A8
MERHNNVKVNTVFNGEFVSGDKSANKSVNTRNYELFRTSDLHEWYERRVVEPTLASLEEFQERDSGWALSRILDLTVNINKYNPMRAGCHIKLPREITMKRAVINVQSKDNACFAWAVVAALHPAENHVYRESSYPHYTTVLNLQDIEFPMTLSQIKKFELHNNISINVYCIEKENNIVPICLSEQKKDRHVNLLYMQDSQDIRHFAWIKNLSRLVSSQLSKKEHKKYICDRYDKLQSHIVDCREMNECAIRLPSDKDKWFAFNNYNRKERLPFVVYADLECVLRKTDGDPMASTYTFQHHQVREFQGGERVECRNYYEQAKWVFGKIKKHVGLLHYMIRLDNGKCWKRHIDQIQKVGNIPQKRKDWEEIWDYNPPEKIEAPVEHRDQNEVKKPQDQGNITNADKDASKQNSHVIREGENEQGVSERATPRKSIRNRVLPKRYGSYIAH